MAATWEGFALAMRYAHLTSDHLHRKAAAHGGGFTPGKTSGSAGNHVTSATPVEPPMRFELMAYGLRNRCSTN